MATALIAATAHVTRERLGRTLYHSDLPSASPDDVAAWQACLPDIVSLIKSEVSQHRLHKGKRQPFIDALIALLDVEQPAELLRPLFAPMLNEDVVDALITYRRTLVGGDSGHTSEIALFQRGELARLAFAVGYASLEVKHLLQINDGSLGKIIQQFNITDRQWKRPPGL